MLGVLVSELAGIGVRGGAVGGAFGSGSRGNPCDGKGDDWHKSWKLPLSDPAALVPPVRMHYPIHSRELFRRMRIGDRWGI
jgi:hypothetical protein